MSENNFNLFCKYHNKKIAKRYCHFCKEYLCNGCSLNGTHIKHIEKVNSFYDEILNYKIYNIGDYSFQGNFYKDSIELFNYILNYQSDSNKNIFDLYYSFRKIEILINDTIDKLISLKQKYKSLYDNNLNDINDFIIENEKIVKNTQNILLNKINNDKEIIKKLNDLFEKVSKEKDYGKIMNYYNENKEIINDCLGKEENIKEKVDKIQFLKQLKKYKEKIDFYGNNIIEEINPIITQFKINLDSFYNLIDGKDITLKKDLKDIFLQNKSVEKTMNLETKDKNPNLFNLYEPSSTNYNILKENNHENNILYSEETKGNLSSETEEKEKTNNRISSMSEFFTLNKETLFEKDYKTQKIKELYSSFILLSNNSFSNNLNKLNRETIISQLSNLTWPEINMTEIIYLKENTSKVIIYNIYTNKIEEIETGFKFPFFFSSIIINPYIYLTGGMDKNNNINNYIIRFRRNGIKNFSNYTIGTLKSKHYNHSSIFIPFLNSIFIISGSKNKKCESFNILNEKTEFIPSLNYSRENSGLCLINEKILYVFFGFNRNISKFLTSFEKLDLNEINNKENFFWEIFNVPGNPNLIKKTLFSCIYYKNNDKDGILIIGGKNNKRNDCKDVLFFDINNINYSIFENSDLNDVCSFSNCNFLSFDFSSKDLFLLYNISQDSKVFLFNCKIGKFINLN